MSRVVRFRAGALEDLGAVCEELGVERPLLVTTRRGAAAVADRVAVVGVYDGVRPHVPLETVEETARLAGQLDADGLVGLGGGSAIDTCKAVAAERARAADESLVRQAHKVLPVVAVPTTYAGAEWTPFFGIRFGPGKKGGGMDARVVPAAALYDPELTLDLPVPASVGTAMNALAHCAEAYYHPATNEHVARDADAGATAIAEALPLVVSEPRSLDARTRLLEGAMRAAFALGASGLCLAHAMAQALGGRYDLPQGTMNALCLPAAVRFNEEAVPEAVARLARAIGASDAASGCEELARLGGFGRLRDHGVPLDDLPEVAEAIVARPGAQANPRPVTPADVQALLLAIW